MICKHIIILKLNIYFYNIAFFDAFRSQTDKLHFLKFLILVSKHLFILIGHYDIKIEKFTKNGVDQFDFLEAQFCLKKIERNI